ncbi:VanZ family protein [Planococcus shenhongbingii]|uniref:VanZ family protein n=1 Tax=Planococcus shenhongbingii TaxID=3058398 RepID=UPI00262C9BA7|nr:VanZ family protein [Planococcus sp. N016]WKA57847.1 VanZ family protein [Planococcus sp. N016]
MKKILIFLILFIILFVSSGQTYEEQSLIPALEKYLPSEPFKGVLSHLEIPYWGTHVSIEERGYHKFIEFLLRKGAHVLMFGLIALAVLNLLPKPKVWLAFIIALAIALMDEFHQSLTGGRTPAIQDVLLDAFGALLFLSIWLLWNTGKRKTKEQ